MSLSTLSHSHYQHNPCSEPSKPNFTHFHIYLKSILIFSFHLYLDHPKFLFMYLKNSESNLNFSSILATCPAHFDPLDLFNLSTLDGHYMSWSFPLWRILYTPNILFRILLSNAVPLARVLPFYVRVYVS